MTRNIPEKVHLASLPSDPLKMSLNGFFEPFVVIGDHQVHPTQSPALERSRSMSSQEASFSLSPNVSPRISRCPSSETPVAINAATGTTLSSFLTWITRASNRRKGYEPFKRRFRQ